MADQLLLSLDLPRSKVPDLADFDLIVVNSSAGKDSQAMLDYIIELAIAAGVLDRIIVIHNDLGFTDSGLAVEWPGTQTLARLQADAYGVPLDITCRELGGLFQQARTERRAFPSSAARWCTSDQKTSQAMKRVTAHVNHWKIDRGIPIHKGRPVKVLYCLGLRGEESYGRARKPVVAIDDSQSNSRRTITRWLPIHDWTHRDVWDRIHTSKIPYHPAYDWGMPRLSCSLCVLSSWDDVVLAARLRPALVQDYLSLEQEFAAQPDRKLAAIANFRADFSVRDVAAAARAAGPLAFACHRWPDCPVPPVPIVHDVHDPFAAPSCEAHPQEQRTRLIAA